MGRDIAYDRWSCDLLCAASSPDLYRINLEQGDGMTSIEPSAGSINDVCVIRNSGLMLMALESTQIPSYFIASLGPAPKWCSYLENLTEELEEGAQTTIYDDFKFVTKEDIERLNLTNLIGTNLLRAYMHGYFIDYRLYLKAKSMADPFAYEAYRKKRIQEKIEAERANRITIKRRLPKVNKNLAARLIATEDGEDGQNEPENEDVAVKKHSSKKRKNTGGSELLKDERFVAMFRDEEFEVDEFSPEYLALHPNAANKKSSLVEEHFEAVDVDSQEEDEEIVGTDDSSSEELPLGNKAMKRKHKAKWKEKPAKGPRLYEVKDESHAQAFRNQVSFAKEHALPLEERIKAIEKKANSNDLMKGQGGSREISFISHSFDEGKTKSKFGFKRGVQSLRLKPERKSFKGGSRGRGRGGGGGSSSKRR